MAVPNFLHYRVHFFLSGYEWSIAYLYIRRAWSWWLVFNFSIMEILSFVDVLIHKNLLTRVHFSAMHPRNLRYHFEVMTFRQLVLDQLFFSPVKRLILAQSWNHPVREVFHKQSLLDRVVLKRVDGTHLTVIFILRIESEYLRHSKLFENLGDFFPVQNIYEYDIDIERLTVSRHQLFVKLEAIKPHKLTAFALNTQVPFTVINLRWYF